MKTIPILLVAACAFGAALQTPAQTPAQDYTSGITALEAKNAAAANQDFSKAVAGDPANPAYNFFYAATQIMTLPDSEASDDFLTRIGVAGTGRDIYHWTAAPAENGNGHLAIPPATPPLNASEFSAQLRTNVLPVVSNVQNNLAAIKATSFTVNLTAAETQSGDVTVDWGDVQMLRSICYTKELFIYMAHSWNLDVQLQAATNYFGRDGNYEAFLTNFPAAFSTASTADLPAAQNAFTNAIGRYLAASQFIASRPKGVVRLFNLHIEDSPSELRFRETLTNLLTSIKGTPVPLAINPAYTVSANNLFNGNFDLRACLPAFDGRTFVWDSFPDTSFGGVVGGVTETNVGKRLLHYAQAELMTPGFSQSVIYNYTNAGGPSGIVQGGDGSFYGAMSYGGPYVEFDASGQGFGSLYKISSTGAFSALYEFGSDLQQTNVDVPGYLALDGAYPNAPVFGPDGNLYGTTQFGGSNNTGVAFKITPAGQYSILHTFGAAGDELDVTPASALTLGTNGLFYGTTEFGGANQAGSVFSMDTNGNVTTLAAFPQIDGVYPIGENPAGAALIQGDDGNFYGVAATGGAFGSGTLFQVTPTGQLTALHVFGSVQDEFGDPLDGATPTGLIQGPNHILYGATEYGGANYYYGDGTIFGILPADTNSFATEYNFGNGGGDGRYPIGSLVAGTNGSFYGTASAGGANQDGAVYAFSPEGSVSNIVWMNSAIGEFGHNLSLYSYFEWDINNFYGQPVAPSFLMTGVDGNIYGITTDGGTYGNGTLLRLAQTGLQYSIDTSASPSAGGTVTGGGLVSAGSSNSITASANPGYQFIGWTGDASGSENPLPVEAAGNLSIVANFAATNGHGYAVTLAIRGTGSVSPNPNGKSYNAGSRVSLTAGPGKGYFFAGWTGSIVTNGNPLVVPKLEANLALQANFVTNPFAPFIGSYNGLFIPTNGATEATAGMLRTLIVNQKGSYSGSLLLNGATHSLSGAFNLAGSATNVIAIKAASGGNVTVIMNLTSNGPLQEIDGLVRGNNWVAPLNAGLADASYPAAEFTLLIPPDTNDTPPTVSPGGGGYALLTNHLGAIKISGALADGTVISESTTVSQDGYVPLFASLYSGKGLLIGWINLDLTNFNATGLTWIRPPVKGTLYTSGFTNLLPGGGLPLSRWTKPANFSGLAGLTVFDSNGGSTNIGILVTPAGKISGAGASGTITPQTGLVTLSVSSFGHKATAHGALLNATNGGGYWIINSTSAAIQLGP